MRREKGVCVVFLFLFFIGIVWYVAGKVETLCYHDVYCLSIKKENIFFSKSDLDILNKSKIQCTYLCESYPNVSNGMCQSEIPVVATNENYQWIFNKKMKEGTFFNSRQVDRKLKLAVISVNAAYQMFGNCHCVGEYVYLNTIPFKIIGIVKEDDGETAKIYVPNLLFNELEEQEACFSQMWCVFNNDADMMSAIGRMEHLMKDISIVKIDFYKSIFWQRVEIIIICFAVFIIYKIIGKIILLKRKIAKRSLSCLAIGIVCVFFAAHLLGRVIQAQGLLGTNEGVDFLGFFRCFYVLADVKICNMPIAIWWNLLSMSLTFSSIILLFLILKSEKET